MSDSGNGKAIAFGVNALAASACSQAREWIDRALLVDPDNYSVRFNCACALSARLGDTDAAIELLGAFLRTHRAAMSIMRSPTAISTRSVTMARFRRC